MNPINLKTVTINDSKNIQESTFEILEATGTNWSSLKIPLVTESGLKTESYGIFRSDSNQWLGTTKGQYEPMNNSLLAETLVEASVGIGEQFRGGTLQGGRKVFYQIALPDYKIETDTVKRWITALNSHDGSTSIGFGSANTVVICQNTFYKAFKEVEKFRHTFSAKERINQAKLHLMATLSNDKSLMQSYEKMTEHKIDKPIFDAVLNRLFGADTKTNEADLSTRKTNTMKQFNQVLGSELNSHGETLWGLFNAVTFFENHVRASEDTKLDSIFTGMGRRNMNATFDEIIGYIEKHEKKDFVMA